MLRRRKAFMLETVERVGYCDAYNPPAVVPVREVWVDGVLSAITTQSMLMLDAAPLTGLVATRYLACGDESVIRYQGRQWWDAVWLMDQFPGAASAIRDYAARCCKVRGWRVPSRRGAVRIKPLGGGLRRTIPFDSKSIWKRQKEKNLERQSVIVRVD